LKNDFFSELYLKIQFLPHRKNIIKTSWLMLSGEIFPVYTHNMKNTYKFCGQNAELFNVYLLIYHCTLKSQRTKTPYSPTCVLPASLLSLLLWNRFAGQNISFQAGNYHHTHFHMRQFHSFLACKKKREEYMVMDDRFPMYN
jgi:hypothetical protein